MKHTRIAIVTYDDQEAVLIQKKSNLQKHLFLKSHKIVLQTEIKWVQSFFIVYYTMFFLFVFVCVFFLILDT